MSTSPPPIEFLWNADGAFLGKSFRPWRWVGKLNKFLAPENLHYYCPKCGEQWGSAITTSLGETCRHLAIGKLCSSCGLGSLRHYKDWAECLDHLPEGVLAREIILAHRDPEDYTAHTLWDMR